MIIPECTVFPCNPIQTNLDLFLRHLEVITDFRKAYAHHGLMDMQILAFDHSFHSFGNYLIHV